MCQILSVLSDPYYFSAGWDLLAQKPKGNKFKFDPSVSLKIGQTRKFLAI